MNFLLQKPLLVCKSVQQLVNMFTEDLSMCHVRKSHFLTNIKYYA